MKSKIILTLVAWALIFCSCTKTQKFIVKSPTGSLSMGIDLTDGIKYNIDYKDSTLIKNAKLGFVLENGSAFSQRVSCIKSETNTVDESYDLLFGKRKVVTNHFNEITLSLKEDESLERKINIQIRVYDEAIAFRYLFPKQVGLDSLKILNEETNFTFPQNPLVYFLPLRDYYTSHEGIYSVEKLDSIPSTLIDLPVLLKFPNNIWMALLEANLTDYPGMYLRKTPGSNSNLISSLSSYPSPDGVKVLAKTPHQTPWRVIMVSDDYADLAESDIVVNLNEPNRIEDTSWIKPGKSTWHWWNGTKLENVDFQPGMNYETMKHYIDFCARNGIEYHALVENRGPWYQDPERKFWDPGPTADVTAPVPELQMEKLVAYAQEKGVGLRLWVHWRALNMKMEKAFQLYHQWGVKGLMVDFMDRDDQEMVNFYQKCLEMAAKYQLHIQFHGAYKPTGIRRTYPNLLTREGVLNTEYFGTCNPDHDVMVPFTRMLAGPMDYHLGGFHSIKRGDPCHVGEVYGTRCHHLAMYVVYESYLQLVCDYPEAYEGQTGFDFVKQVPTTWDDMKFINGEVGDYISIARRSGNDWYIGMMTNWTPRDLTIPLDFLPEGNFDAEIYADMEDSDIYPNHLNKKIIQVSNQDTIPIKLASGGGDVLVIRGKTGQKVEE